MSRYRTINVNLDRQYRNDLNWNFEQIGIDLTNMEAGLNTVVEDLIGGGFIESLEAARDNANAAATHASSEAQYATTQGSFAKSQGDYAKAQGDYAKQKGDYADEKAVAADEAAGRANTEATGLEALKIAVIDATQAANTQADRADVAATSAEASAQYAKEQGDYAKRMADDIADKSGVTSINGKSGAVTLTADDVGGIPTSEKGTAGGVAMLNEEGKVVDALGNEVEGKVTSVNGLTGDVVISTADIGAATPEEVQKDIGTAIAPLTTQLANHESRLNQLENDTGKVAANVTGLYRETAWLKLKQEAKDRIDGGVTFADDFSGNRFGFSLNESESQSIKIRDGKMVMIEDLKTSHSAVDEVVVNQAYSTAGNGGRKIVQLDNGWIVAVCRNSLTTTQGSFYFFLNKLDGEGFKPLCYMQNTSYPIGDSIAIASKGEIVHVVCSNNNASVVSISFNVKTVLNTNLFKGGGLKSIDIGQTAIGNVSLAIDPSNGQLHVAWASKNATFPNVFNIRYSKSMDSGFTWSEVEQITTSAKDYSSNPSIVVINREPIIVAERSNGIFIYKKTGLPYLRDEIASWTYNIILSSETYKYQSPSAVVGKDGAIHVAWHGSDSSTAYFNIHYRKSEDGGISWSRVEKLTNETTTNTINPSISVNSENKIFIAFLKTRNNSSFFIKHDVAWSEPILLGKGEDPSTLDNNSLNFEIPLTVRKETNSVLFNGEWTETVEEPRTTATAVYDIPSTDYVGAFVQKEGAITVSAFLNNILMDSVLDDDEYKFETAELLPSPVPAKLRIELSRQTIDGGENDAITRILGGRA